MRSFVVASTLWLATAVFAEPPEVAYLFPAGVERGKSQSVRLGGKFSWPLQVWTNRPGLTVKPESEGLVRVAAAADAVPGIYRLRFHDHNGASALRSFQVGVVPDVLEKEPNDDPLRPQPLPDSAVVVNGKLEKAGDVDAFAVEVEAGRTLVASMAAHSTFGSPMDAVLQITDARGFVVAQNHDRIGLDPRVVYRVPRAGKFLVRCFAFPAKPNSSIRFEGGADFVYRLTVASGPFADFALPSGEGTDAPSEARVFGWNLPDSPRTVPLRPLPPRKAVDGLLIVAEQGFANAVFLPTTPHPFLSEPEGGFGKEPRTITFPTTIWGRIAENGQVDRYRIKMRKGQSLDVSADADRLGSPLDPYLSVIDPAGKTLLQIDDVKPSRDVKATQKFPSDGNFDLAVRDLHRRGGPDYVYRLTIQETQPDFELTAAADRFTVKPGESLEIPVTIVRSGGMTGDVEISAVNLPEGVTASPVVSRNGDQTAKSVKLIVQAKQPAGGPIQIIGASKRDGADVTRAATAPIKALGERTRRLWLTVTPASPKK